MNRKLRVAMVVGLLASGLAPVHAAYVTTTVGTITTFFGLRNTTPSPLPAFSDAPTLDALDARNAFAGSQFVSISGTESFSLITGTQPFTSTALAASIGCVRPANPPAVPNPADSCSVISTGVSGRYDTTGDAEHRYLSSTTLTDATAPIVITFNAIDGISAFGFYGTDVGDFAGDFSIELTDVSGNKSTLTIIDNTDPVEGSLLFFGFYDSTTAYRSISFINSVKGDVFGLRRHDRRQLRS
ncbi:MAG: hypothetical protein IPH51_17025 [Rubrivivax sp.]|nr:hypothetical protein [Rubrivivax sp.]